MGGGHGLSWPQGLKPYPAAYTPKPGDDAFREKEAWRLIRLTHGRGREDLSWQTGDLACLTDPDSFFPEGHEYGEPEARVLWKVCRACPVQSLCLDYGTRHDEEGYWGGLSQEKRRQYRRERAAAAERHRQEAGEVAA
jgi:hypothetical protein